jgi:hypothetical protein
MKNIVWGKKLVQSTTDLAKKVEDKTLVKNK